MAETATQPHPLADLSDTAVHVLHADHERGMHFTLDFDCPGCLASLEDERLREKRRAG
jgi:hypothetical protein